MTSREDKTRDYRKQPHGRLPKLSDAQKQRIMAKAYYEGKTPDEARADVRAAESAL